VTNRTLKSIEFPSAKKRKVLADFSGGDISGDGGALVLGQADRLIGLTKSVSKAMKEKRQQGNQQGDERKKAAGKGQA